MFFTTPLLICSCSNYDNSNNSYSSLPEHMHTYSSNWSSDETKHWHGSTCGHDVKKDEGTHTFSDWTVKKETTGEVWLKERTCSICGYS